MAKTSTILPIATLLEEYDTIREQKKQLDSRLKYLSDLIKKEAEKSGVKDDKGNYYAETEEFIYGEQARKSVSFDEEKAIAYFKSRGFNDCVKVVEVIDEDAVEEHINSGDIKLDDLTDITKVKITYAIDVKRKEEMPEVEIAALRKTTVRRK